MLFTKFLSKTVDFTYEFSPLLIYVMGGGFIFMDKVSQVIPALNVRERGISCSVISLAGFLFFTPNAIILVLVSRMFGFV